MRKFPVACLALVSLLGVASEPQTVYRSIDENGVVNFSDIPPGAGVETEIVTIEVPPPGSPDEYQQRLEEMRATTDRMVADRRERERHRAEMRELEARTAVYEQASSSPPQDYDIYREYGTVWRGRYAPGVVPPWRPPPVYPVPLPSIQRPYPTYHNSQLMRPILPRQH